MEFIIHKIGYIQIAELKTAKDIIINTEEIMDLLGNAAYLGAGKIIIHSAQLHPDFFDLKTGMAGEILQKFSNYRMSMAIVGEFEKIPAKSLRDFIFESNKRGQICFVNSIQEAIDRLNN